VNLTTITKRIEALEEQRGAKAPTRYVSQIWKDGVQIGGYTGPITSDILVIARVIVSPPERERNSMLLGGQRESPAIS
jgi:hypothetical protein